jgi:hypothetical protein
MGAGFIPAFRAQAGKMPTSLSGNLLKIQPPLSPNQTSRKFQEVGSDLSGGDMKH